MQHKVCARCQQPFEATGRNCKRCAPCRREHHLEKCKERWHAKYERKGYNQTGENNNAWKGGTSPEYYQRIAYEAHGTLCARCPSPAVLVHHKDEDHSNSDPANLEPLCKRCHQLEHACAANLPKVVVFKPRTCASCLERFVPTGPRGSKCDACKSR